MKQNTKKLEKMVKAFHKDYDRAYLFISETKLGTLGKWLTNGHFAYIVEVETDLVKLGTIDKNLLDGQQVLVGMDNLEGYDVVDDMKTIFERGYPKGFKYDRALITHDVEVGDGYQVLINNEYFEAIREAFPQAKVYTKDATSKVLFIEEETKRLVAVCMPLRQ